MIFDKNAGSACLEMNRSNIAPLWNLFLGQPRFLGKCDITIGFGFEPPISKMGGECVTTVRLWPQESVFGWRLSTMKILFEY